MKHSHPLKRLWDLILLEKQEITSIYFYAILGGLVQLSLPLGVQAIIGFVLGATMVTSIYVLITLVVLGVLTVGLLQINQMKMIEKIQQKIFVRNAFEFAECIPRFDLLKVDNYYLPEKANRFFDTNNIQKGLSKLLLDIPIASIQILLGLLLLSLYHPIFIAFGLLLVLLLAIILKVTSYQGLATSIEESNYKYAVVGWLEEMARVLKSFKFSQGTHLNLQKTDNYVVGYLTARTSHFKVLLFQYKTLVLFKVMITATMLMVGTYLLLSQKLNIGEFIAAEIVILMVIAAVEKLIGSLESVYDVITGLEKIASVAETALEEDGSTLMDAKNKGIAIEMKDCGFAYPGGKHLLSDINISIESNSLVCISGSEGSGKTTFLKLMSGNYSDFDGSIILNRLPINAYNLASLRANIGVYLHTQEIFNATLWENISMGRAEVTPESIAALSEQMGIEHLLHQQDMGYETYIDPTGKKLSSTMIKKILLLRAFAHKPHLLLLEEPWMGLEENIKNTMIRFLEEQKKSATLFVTSNEEDFAKKCDYHITLNNGKASIIKNKA